MKKYSVWFWGDPCEEAECVESYSRQDAALDYAKKAYEDGNYSDSYQVCVADHDAHEENHEVWLVEGHDAPMEVSHKRFTVRVETKVEFHVSVDR